MKKYYRLLAGLIVASALFYTSNASASSAATLIGNGTASGVTYDNASGAYPVITAIYSKPGTVNGRTYTGWTVFLADTTGSILIYNINSAAAGSYFTNVAVGDAVTMSGNYGTYQNIPEFTATAITLQSKDNANPVTLPKIYYNCNSLSNSVFTDAIHTMGWAPLNLKAVTLYTDSAGTIPATGTFPVNANQTYYAKDGFGTIMQAYGYETSYSVGNANLGGASIPVGQTTLEGFTSVYNSTAQFSFVNLVGSDVHIKAPVAQNVAQSVTSIGPLELDVWTINTNTAASDLIVTASASDPSIVTGITLVTNLVTDPTGTNRSITLTLSGTTSGQSTVTITAIDAVYTTTNTAAFLVQVGAPSFITDIPNLVTKAGSPANSIGPIPFTVWDYETPNSLTVAAVNSTDTNIVSLSNVVLSGTGTNRTMTITPAAGTNGYAVITLAVSDATPLTNTQYFYVTVAPQFGVLFNANFNSYSAGDLVQQLGGNGPWSCTSACDSNDFFVVSGMVQSSYTNFEDVGTCGNFGAAFLQTNVIGSQPYQFTPSHGNSSDTTGNTGTTNICGGVLYSTFTLNAAVLPHGNGSYFAHFKDTGSSTFKGRVWVATNGAAAGNYRVAVTSGATTPTTASTYPMDLVPGTTYTVVSRYMLPSGDSTVWINPKDEGDTSVWAVDAAGGSYICNYGLRQGTGATSSDDQGVLYIDNLAYATAFTDVVPATAPTVTTLAASGVTASAATLNGTADPNGANTSVYYQYGLTAGYGSFSSTNTVVAGSGLTAAPIAISGLSSGTLYHFQAFGKNSAGTTGGGDLTFTTVSVAPPSPKLNYSYNNVTGTLSLSWTGSGFGVYSSSSPVGPRSGWTLVGSTSPVTVSPLSGTQKYYTLWGQF